MKLDLFEVQHYLEFKDIALLGNASSILNTKKDIDKHEIVCRINRGLPRGKMEFLGSRTDILFTATKLSNDLISNFKAKYVIWTTKCQNLTTPWLLENAYQNPVEDWEKLKALCPEDKLPSTGIVSLQFILKHIHFKTLTLYGFDNFATGTYYHQMKNQPWHMGDWEKEWVSDAVKDNPNMIWIKE